MMTVTFLKWLQFAQSVLVFILPALVVAWLIGRRRGLTPWRWLRLDQPVDWRMTGIGMLLIVVASPAVNLLADLNSMVHLPWPDLEANLRAKEDAAAEITMLFLQPRAWYDLPINICLMAFLPALSEELFFRGMMLRWQKHVAVWTVAILFSAIHMQFYGFVPRMLLGAWLGYMYIWTGNLWTPILMHATNNLLAVVSYHIIFSMGKMPDEMDSFGAGDTWYVGVASLIITIYAIQRHHRAICDQTQAH